MNKIVNKLFYNFLYFVMKNYLHFNLIFVFKLNNANVSTTKSTLLWDKS